MQSLRTLLKLNSKKAKADPVPPLQGSSRCRLLELPAELRLKIYHEIAPRAFLPLTHHKNYFGLFLSCKKIHHEMEYEALCASLIFLDHYRTRLDNFVFMFEPHRFSLASFLQIRIQVPIWCLESKRKMNSIVKSIQDVTSELHLSSLTLIFEDVLPPRVSTLSPWQLSRLSSIEQHELRDILQDLLTNPQTPHQLAARSGNLAEYYRLPITYTQVVKFALRINCLVTPAICSHHHNLRNDITRSCIHRVVQWRNGVVNLPSVIPNPLSPCHTRKVVLEIAKLDQDDYSNNNVYLFGSWTRRIRMSPEWEGEAMRKEGWNFCWWRADGKQGHALARKEPVSFVWGQREERKKRKNGRRA
ncbi:hypothetical protein CC80DRAFT_580598 [Byssothecium circinans]|uniref:F-box domain-containing protein n=1 Tax=Byssothecium circinans TaxID=147558 RepID=A0A6A5U821_9PLEO|nr:hypothetical protein CC80DRAFT_580598 [Byssothecium circinans]